LEWFDITFDAAEPETFVYYKIEVDPAVPRERFTAFVTNNVVLGSHTEPGRGIISGGTRIGRKREARLGIVIQPETVPLMVKVYLRDFSFGNPEDAKASQSDARWAS